MNETYVLVGIGAAIVIGVLLWLSSKKKVAVKKPFTGNVENGPPVVDAFADSQTNDAPGSFEAEVRMLIDYGNKIEAVRIVREKLGLDLNDAKDLIDKMEQGAPIPIAVPIADSTTSNMSTMRLNDEDSEIRQLVNSGRLIEAIKLAREKKGLDLKQAKAYVERL